MNFGETDCKYSVLFPSLRYGVIRLKGVNMRLVFQSSDLQTKRFIEMMRRFFVILSGAKKLRIIL